MENEDVEIVDERTGEEIPRGANSLMLASNQNTHIEIAKVGTLELTPQAEESLNKKLNPVDVRIRPDGLVYLPWTYYSNRLNEAFGRLQWGLIPQGAPHVKPQGDYGDILVVWGFWLAIKGVPIGFAYGETTYKPSNPTMSYGDACEGAKSIALARNCKQLGVALELWDQAWVAKWKAEYAETYKDKNDKIKWCKKSAKNSSPEKAYSTESSQEAPQSTQAPSAAETTSEAPKAPENEKAAVYTQLQVLSNISLVNEIATSVEKPVVDVCKFLGKVEKGKKFSVAQYIEMLKAG